MSATIPLFVNHGMCLCAGYRIDTFKNMPGSLSMDNVPSYISMNAFAKVGPRPVPSALRMLGLDT